MPPITFPSDTSPRLYQYPPIQRITHIPIIHHKSRESNWILDEIKADLDEVGYNELCVDIALIHLQSLSRMYFEIQVSAIEL
ncbi:hypothetical protein AXF17_03755 [Mogibacterium pumilum]|uniref:Uncharacterized protein n=1 Tax=Mogibacterium pumilum TaxID=86332 RepID=A0A223ARU4_9FIRM|nr:hypothetical protein AXF17_03755 [Mogibacterium pumilum]